MIKTRIDNHIIHNLLKGVKEHLRILDDDFNDILLDYLEAAIDIAENQTGNIFVLSEIRHSKKSNKIDIGGFYPIKSVECTFNGEPIEVNFDGGRIYQEFEEEGLIELTITAGYEKIPPAVKGSVYLAVGDMFKNPENRVDGMQTLSGSILRQFKRWQR